MKATVAPHAGAWVETVNLLHLIHILRSLPMRERGLKRIRIRGRVIRIRVAPRVGAWIETGLVNIR